MPKNFGPSPEEKERKSAALKEERLWELIECDFDVLKRQRKAHSPEEYYTLLKMQSRLIDLTEIYEKLNNIPKEQN
jgi:hypothetical protein